MIGSSLRRLMGGRGDANAQGGMRKRSEPDLLPPQAFHAPDLAANEPGVPPATVVEPLLKPTSSHEVGQLMAAINEQSNELQNEFAKISNWSVQLDLLMTRTATMQQILPKFIQTSQDQAALIEELRGITSRQDREIAGLQSELGHYRPLAMRYEEELQRNRVTLDQTQASLATLETDHGKLQGEFNGLLQKLATADSRFQRLAEERQVVEQKLQEKSSVAQNMSREVAILRSDVVAADGENQRLQRDLASLTEKMGDERGAAGEASTQAQARIVASTQTIKELQAQAAASAERERRLTEELAQRDKRVYDLDIKVSALQSKADFLAGVNTQLRSDLRHHIDHVGTLEHSNRQLIEAMSRSRQAAEAMAPEGYDLPPMKAASGA